MADAQMVYYIVEGDSPLEADVVVLHPRPSSPISPEASQRRRIYTFIWNSLVATLVMLLITTALTYIILMGKSRPPPLPTDKLPRPPPARNMTFNFLRYSEFAATRANATWLRSHLVHRNAEGHIELLNVRDGTVRKMVDNSELDSTISYQVSADARFVMLQHYLPVRMWRPKRLLSTYSTRRVWPPGFPRYVGRSPGLLSLVEAALFGPHGSQLVYVQRRNIFYIPSADYRKLALQITFTGGPDLTHGLTDWSNERYMFDSHYAMWFAPNGDYLAFLSFDDRQVLRRKSYAFDMAGNAVQTAAVESDPRIPMVAHPNPTIRMSVVQVGRRSISQTMVGVFPTQMTTKRGNEPLVSAVTWTADSRWVLAVWLNRRQNQAAVQRCTVFMQCETFSSFREDNAWLRIPGPLHYYMDERETVVAMVQPVDRGDEEGGSMQQIMLHRLHFTDQREPLLELNDTNHVERIVHWDHVTNTIFYMGNERKRPEERHLFAVQVEEVRTVCLTCSIARPAGRYTHFQATLDPRSRMVLLESEGPSLPRHDVYEWQTDAAGRVLPTLQYVRYLEGHDEVRHRVYNVSMPVMRFESVPLTQHDGRLEARVMLLLPPAFDECNATQNFPLLIEPYGGPDEYAGRPMWRMDWEAFMAVNRSVVVALFDVSGSSRLSRNVTHSVARSLGWREAADVLDVTAQLLKRLPCLDKERVGMYGFGYGGFVIGMTMADDVENTIRCGAMAHPIADWSAFPSLYVERYLGLFDPETYRKSSLLLRSNDLKGKMLYLVHTSKKIVDYHQSIVLGRALRRLGALVQEHDFQEDDELSLRYHRNLNRFFDRCFTIFKPTAATNATGLANSTFTTNSSDSLDFSDFTDITQATE